MSSNRPSSNQPHQKFPFSLAHIVHGSLLAIAASAIACGGADKPAENNATGGAVSVGGAGGSTSVRTTGGASSGGKAAGTGGNGATGGSKNTGGAVPTGGANATGGAVATGGKVSTGGTLATGGASPTGGVAATGGAATGGTRPTGGASATGGGLSTGGKTSTTGGTTSTTGGNSTIGGNSTTGGSSSPGGSSSATGGKATGGSSAATGGATATGGTTNGGVTATGGAATGGAATGGGSSCPGLTQPCGGGLVGTWNVTSSCLNVSGQADLTAANIGCPQAPATGSRHVTGTWTFSTDGTTFTFADATTTTGDDQVTLAPACMNTSGTTIDCGDRLANAFVTIGYESAVCTVDAAVTGGCNCTAHVNQTGGMALVAANPITDGAYDNTTTANTVSVNNGRKPVPYSYCVAGSTLTVATQSTAPVIAGTVVLAKQ